MTNETKAPKKKNLLQQAGDAQAKLEKMREAGRRAAERVLEKNGERIAEFLALLPAEVRELVDEMDGDE